MWYEITLFWDVAFLVFLTYVWGSSTSGLDTNGRIALCAFGLILLLNVFTLIWMGIF